MRKGTLQHTCVVHTLNKNSSLALVDGSACDGKSTHAQIYQSDTFDASVLQVTYTANRLAPNGFFVL